MGDVNYSVALADATKQMLDKVGLKYDFYEEDGVFQFSMGLGEDQKLRGVRMFVCIREDAVTSYAVADVKVDEASLGAVIEYITRANYGLRFGNFEVDCNDGEVRYKCHNRYEGRIPAETELKYIAAGCAMQMWMRYGNGFLKVLFGGADPKGTIEEVEKGDA